MRRVNVEFLPRSPDIYLPTLPQPSSSNVVPLCCLRSFTTSKPRKPLLVLRVQHHRNSPELHVRYDSPLLRSGPKCSSNGHIPEQQKLAEVKGGGSIAIQEHGSRPWSTLETAIFLIRTKATPVAVASQHQKKALKCQHRYRHSLSPCRTIRSFCCLRPRDRALFDCCYIARSTIPHLQSLP